MLRAGRKHVGMGVVPMQRLSGHFTRRDLDMQLTLIM
jgi:hypothetical protein